MNRALQLFSGFALIGFLFSCGGDEETPLPYVEVNEVINLTNMDYVALQNDNGAVTINGGWKGIIIVRQSASRYAAFERACPSHMDDTCAVVSIAPSRLFLEDDCCSTQFNFDGSVRSGSSTRPLMQYSTNISGNLLYITN